MNEEKVYIIYDERAILQGTDEAVVLESCFSIEELKKSKEYWNEMSPVYVYDMVNGQATNQQFHSLLKDI